MSVVLIKAFVNFSAAERLHHLQITLQRRALTGCLAISMIDIVGSMSICPTPTLMSSKWHSSRHICSKHYHVLF